MNTRLFSWSQYFIRTQYISFSLKRNFYQSSFKMSGSISIANKDVSVSLRPGPFKHSGSWTSDNKEKIIEDVLKFKPFLQWAEKLSSNIESENYVVTINKIEITDLDYFGGKRLGFVKFITDAVWNDTQKAIPGIVFCRGGAVSILILIDVPDHNTENDPYVLLTIQPRIPIGTIKCVELPAGMLDGDSNFVGVAAKEIEEETGLKLNNLVNMNDLIYVDKQEFDGNIYLSGGGCDEYMHFFVTRVGMCEDVFNELKNKETGSIEENERIKLKTVRLSNLWKSTSDSKAFISLGLYQSLKENGKLPSQITEKTQ